MVVVVCRVCGGGRLMPAVLLQPTATSKHLDQNRTQQYSSTTGLSAAQLEPTGVPGGASEVAVFIQGGGVFEERVGVKDATRLELPELVRFKRHPKCDKHVCEANEVAC